MVRIARFVGAGVGLAAIVLSVAALQEQSRAEGAQRMAPPATSQTPGGDSGGLQTAVFAGGCFWGVQGVFEHVRGVTQAVSGYAGGQVADPGYERVSSGATGHAESVQVTFDPAQISYGKLLQIFFSVALDPTEIDRQGPDRGTQYRSELFVDGPEQERTARSYIAQLDSAHLYSRPVATRVDPAGPFYPAEAYHQDYLARHPDQSYIAAFDMPKLRALRSMFPDSWRDAPVTVASRVSSN